MDLPNYLFGIQNEIGAILREEAQCCAPVRDELQDLIKKIEAIRETLQPEEDEHSPPQPAPKKVTLEASPEVESKARELCIADGFDPDVWWKWTTYIIKAREALGVPVAKEPEA